LPRSNPGAKPPHTIRTACHADRGINISVVGLVQAARKPPATLISASSETGV
jgi:hypothetical protein